MITLSKTEPLILLLGDIICFVLALWLALFLRYLEAPAFLIFLVHLVPFSILFILWAISFFIAGLYEKHTLMFESQLPTVLFNTQVANAIIAVLFFYFFPFFGINPKTILFLYLVTLLIFIFAWRLYGRKFFSFKRQQQAILIGYGEEARELENEVNNNPRYPFIFSEIIYLSKISAQEAVVKISKNYKEKTASFIVIDVKSEHSKSIIDKLHAVTSPDIFLVDFSDVYEHIFDRVPLESLNQNFFLESASSSSHTIYDFLKRLMDLILGFILTIIGLIIYPLIYLLVKIDDGGPIFIPQVRIGERGEGVVVYKLRTMEESDPRSDKWVPEEKSRITRIGRILRRTSLDEVPQVFNIFKGNMSLIGPRADIEGLGKRLAEEIPNYSLRTLVKPGISGWAQIHQIYKKGNISPQSVEETKLRLAYDLYYVKNRSFFIDLKIALRTVTILLSRLSA